MLYLDEILPQGDQDPDPGDDAEKATDPEVSQGDLNTVTMTGRNLTKDRPIPPLHPEGNLQEQSLHLHLPAHGTLPTLYTRDLLCQEEVHPLVDLSTFDNTTDKMHTMLDMTEETATPIEKGPDLSHKDPDLWDHTETNNDLSLGKI